MELNPDIYRAVLESLPVGIYLTDAKRRIVFWNAGAERITGYLGQEVVGRFCADNLLMHCDEEGDGLCGGACPLAKTILDGHSSDTNIFLRHKDGQHVPVHVRSVAVRDDFGAIIGVAECFETRSYQPAGVIHHQGHRIALDEVTQVADEPSMRAAMTEALARFNLSQEPFGILAIGIDNLEHLRRVYGCQAVNAIFHAVAQTTSAGTRPEDLVANWNRDRFVVLVDCPTAEGLEACGERLRRLTAHAAIPWWGDRLSVTITAAGSMARNEDTVESLLERAGQALEAAPVINSVLVV